MNAKRETQRKGGATEAPASSTVTDAELAEIAPLLPSLIHAMHKVEPRVPPILKKSWGALGERHMRVFIALSSGQQSVGQLSTQLGVTLSTASLLVGELSRAGFVVRAEDPNDRRRTIVDISPEYSQEVSDFVAGRAPSPHRSRAARTAGAGCLRQGVASRGGGVRVGCRRHFRLAVNRAPDRGLGDDGQPDRNRYPAAAYESRPARPPPRGRQLVGAAVEVLTRLQVGRVRAVSVRRNDNSTIGKANGPRNPGSSATWWIHRSRRRPPAFDGR